VHQRPTTTTSSEGTVIENAFGSGGLQRAAASPLSVGSLSSSAASLHTTNPWDLRPCTRLIASAPPSCLLSQGRSRRCSSPRSSPSASTNQAPAAFPTLEPELRAEVPRRETHLMPKPPVRTPARLEQRPLTRDHLCELGPCFPIPSSRGRHRRSSARAGSPSRWQAARPARRSASEASFRPDPRPPTPEACAPHRRRSYRVRQARRARPARRCARGRYV
jgi:hypothetical protein